MAFHVRPLNSTEHVYTSYAAAKESGDASARLGTQASVFEVREDGTETLLITCCRRTPVDQSLGEAPPPQPASPAQGRRGVFVFVDPRSRK